MSGVHETLATILYFLYFSFSQFTFTRFWVECFVLPSFFYQISQNMTRDQPFCLIYPLIRWFTTQLDQNHLWKTMFLQWTLFVAVLY